MILNLGLSALASAALTYYFKLPLMQSIIALISIFIALHVLNGRLLTEGFDTGDNTRYLRYGDSMLFWTHKNRYMRMNTNHYMDITAYMAEPTDIPRNFVWERFVIEDANDDRYMAGSKSPVKYGDKINIRSWLAYGPVKLIRASALGTSPWIRGIASRASNETFTVESPDIAGRIGQPIKYGDPVYLKTWHKTYLSQPETGNYIKQVTKKDSTCIVRVFDEYGQGQDVNWAARGTATQDTQHGSFKASNAINGNAGSYSHTESKQNAWWQVELPRDVNIREINIINRKDANQDRLQDFDVMVLDSAGKPVYSKHFKDTLAQYAITDINRTGRTIKVQLRGKNFLHLAKVIVTGTPINYSILMETPVVADLITSQMTLDEGASKTFHHDAVPYIGNAAAMSLSLFIKPKSGNTGKRNIVSKGNLSVFLDDKTIAIQATTAKGVMDIKTNVPIQDNQWNHIAVAIKPTVHPATGWLYGEFTSKPAGITDACCYVVHPQRREYYKLKEQGEFASSTKHKWTASVVKSMKYLGDLSNNVPSLVFYINGNHDVTHKLDDNISLDNRPLVVGQNTGTDQAIIKGMVGDVNSLRMYNYDIKAETAQRDSRSQHNALSLDLIRTITDGGTQQTINANVLPTISSEVSVSYWIQSTGATKKWQPIFWNGNSEKDKVFGMWFTPEGNLFASVKTYGGSTGGNGLKEIKYTVKPSVWYHITEIFKDKHQSVYVNGKRVASVELPGNVEYSVVPVTVGGFAGKIKDFRYHNFALSDDEVKAQMGVHPDYKDQETVQRLWHEQGCVTDLFKDLESNANYVKLIKAGKEAEVENSLKAIKVAASKGDKEKLVQCYGPYASKLFGKLQKSGELLKYTMDKNSQGKKCLPNAPFECKTKHVNDFDIRTHRDFHKYTLSDRIIPPVQSLSDINIIDHPDFDKFTKQLSASKKALVEMTKLRVKGEESNQILASKLKAIQVKGGFTKDDIVKHPVYTELLNKYKNDAVTLAQIKKEQHATLVSMKQADSEAQNVSENPEYMRIAAELKNARRLAMASIAQKMDLDSVRDNPLFKEILKDVISNTMGQGSVNANIVTLERDLRAQKAQLEQVRSSTMQQLKNTKQMANDIFHGIAGLDSRTVDNIILSKHDLSNSAEYQAMLKNMKLYAGNDAIKQHPEYQKLVNKLNKLTTGQVDGQGNGYQEFKIQAHKCKALFENGGAQVSNDTLMRVFKDRSSSDPQFKALVSNVIESKAATDGDFSNILKKARDEKYLNDPNFQDFLLKVTKEQLKNNPMYSKMVASMIAPKCASGSGSVRLEDHPEYNKYARDIRRECRA
jgi:hypothetical protein